MLVAAPDQRHVAVLRQCHQLAPHIHTLSDAHQPGQVVRQPNRARVGLLPDLGTGQQGAANRVAMRMPAEDQPDITERGTLRHQERPAQQLSLTVGGHGKREHFWKLLIAARWLSLHLGK